MSDEKEQAKPPVFAATLVIGLTADGQVRMTPSCSLQQMCVMSCYLSSLVHHRIMGPGINEVARASDDKAK